MTDAEIIDALGGTMAVAEGLKIDPRVVSNWKTRISGISAAGRYKIRDFARRKRFKLPDGFMEAANG